MCNNAAGRGNCGIVTQADLLQELAEGGGFDTSCLFPFVSFHSVFPVRSQSAKEMEDPWQKAYDYAVEVARIAGEVGKVWFQGWKRVPWYI